MVPSIRRQSRLRSARTQHEISNFILRERSPQTRDRRRRRRHLHRRDPPRRGRPRRRSASCSRRRRATTAPSSRRSAARRPTGPVAEVVHGTTVATNAVLERRGSLTALVTTAGFRDVLELRRLRIPHMYDLFWRKPPPLVERHLRFELNERVAADGTVVRAARRGRGRALAARLARDGRRVGRGLLPALLPLPRARAALRRDPARGAARRRTSRSRARSCASSASTSAPRRRSSTPTCGR